MLYSSADEIFAKELYLERAYVTKSFPLSRTIAWVFFQREYFEEMAKTVRVFKNSSSVLKKNGIVPYRLSYNIYYYNT